MSELTDAMAAEYLQAHLGRQGDRIAELEHENERLRQLIRDLIEGETAEEGTPQWHALRNARAALSSPPRPRPDQGDMRRMATKPLTRAQMQWYLKRAKANLHCFDEQPLTDDLADEIDHALDHIDCALDLLEPQQGGGQDAD